MKFVNFLGYFWSDSQFFIDILVKFAHFEIFLQSILKLNGANIHCIYI